MYGMSIYLAANLGLMSSGFIHSVFKQSLEYISNFPSDNFLVLCHDDSEVSDFLKDFAKVVDKDKLYYEKWKCRPGSGMTRFQYYNKAEKKTDIILGIDSFLECHITKSLCMSNKSRESAKNAAESLNKPLIHLKFNQEPLGEEYDATTIFDFSNNYYETFFNFLEHLSSSKMVISARNYFNEEIHNVEAQKEFIAKKEEEERKTRDRIKAMLNL
jgi:hypothetical protein